MMVKTKEIGLTVQYCRLAEVPVWYKISYLFGILIDSGRFDLLLLILSPLEHTLAEPNNKMIEQCNYLANTSNLFLGKSKTN